MNVFGDDVESVPYRVVDPEDIDSAETVEKQHPDSVSEADAALEAEETAEPITGPETGARPRGRVAAPRLRRHEITLDDGHRVGVAVSGRGLPLVVVHGFSAEGFLYAQSLSRLVSMGFKVVAVDTAGHGGTQGLPAGGANFEAYTRLLSRAVDHLGIRRAVFAGHSMGGRLVTQLAASEPERVVALLCVDAIVGETWDRRVNAMRFFPPVAGLVGISLALDSLLTVPVFRDREQAGKLLRLVAPTLIGHVRRPWRLLGPGASIIRSRGSRWMLQRIGQERVPFFALHGDRDMAVPIRTASEAARRARGMLITVHGGTHSWVLRDPEALPGIVNELLKGPLGRAYRDAVDAAGLDGDRATIAELEEAFYEPDALVLELTPPLEFVRSKARHREPQFEWTIADHRVRHTVEESAS